MSAKRVLMVACACLMALAGTQGRTIRELFAGEPGHIFTMVPTGTRLDLLDYYDNGQIVWAQNNLGHSTSLQAVDSTSITITTSDSRTVQLRLLTQGRRDSVIAVVETVRTPVPDSRLTFYNTSWQPLPAAKRFKQPLLSDFFKPGTDRAVRESLQQLLPFMLIELEFTGPRRLVARQHLKDYLTVEDFAKYRAHLLDSIGYEVRGTAIKPLKH